MFTNVNDVPRHRISSLIQLTRIAEGAEAHSTSNVLHSLLENVAIILGNWNAYKGYDEAFYLKLWNDAPMCLIQFAVSTLNNNQQELFEVLSRSVTLQEN